MSEDKKIDAKETMYGLLEASYFNKDEVRRHVYVELMTLKTLLVAKGVFTEEEFDTCRKQVNGIITDQLREQINQMRNTSPKEAAVMDTLTGLFGSLIRKEDAVS